MISTVAYSWKNLISSKIFDFSKESWERICRFQETTIHLPQENLDISMASSGNGPPLVFLHGFASDRSCWSLIWPFFMKGYRIILIDLPAWGKSSYQSSARYRPIDQAERLEKLREIMQLESWHLIGISMGAAIAGIYAAKYPERMQSLTLLNAAGLSSDQGRPMVDDSLLKNNPLVLEKASDISNLWRHVFFRQPFLTRLYTPALTLEYLRRLTIQKKLFQDLIEDPYSLEKYIFDIKTPTQVIWGQQDRLIDVSCLERLHNARPDFRYHVIERCGHLPILERPRTTAKLMKQWLQTIA